MVPHVRLRAYIIINAWWCLPIISALGRLGLEALEFKAILIEFEARLGYTGRSCLEKISAIK